MWLGLRQKNMVKDKSDLRKHVTLNLNEISYIAHAVIIRECKGMGYNNAVDEFMCEVFISRDLLIFLPLPLYLSFSV